MPISNALTGAAVNAALGYTAANAAAVVPIDANGGVGTIAVCIAGGAIAAGATIAGSSLYKASGDGSFGGFGGTTLPGTWRNIGLAVIAPTGGNNPVSTFQRIA